MAANQWPGVKKGDGILKIDSIDLKTGVKHSKWYHLTTDNEVYASLLDEDPRAMTQDEGATMMERVPDDAIFPELPADPPITMAPKTLDRSTAFFKRPGLRRYNPRGKLNPGNQVKDHLWEEVVTMEELSKRPHPYIVQYLGCRVNRGRITGIVLESLEWNLRDYAFEARDKFAKLDKEAFLAGVESAVKYLHSLGLAHNEIGPSNIMVREADDGSCSPVLIDFGSCGPFGRRLLDGWSFKVYGGFGREPFVSAKKHDELSLECLGKWWDNPGTFRLSSVED